MSGYTGYMTINADLTKVLKGMAGRWVALSKDRDELIDSSENLSELRERLGEKKNQYVYKKVLRSDIEYSFDFSWKTI